MIKLVERITQKYLAFAQDHKIPFEYFIMTFVVWIALRNLLEVFSDQCHVRIISLALHFHFYLFYTCVALTVMLLFQMASGAKMSKVARLVLISFYIVLLAPVLDLIISGGQGFNMAYLSPLREHGNLWLRYLTLTGPFEGIGITIGIKIEAALALILAFFYFVGTKTPLLKNLLSLWLIYTSLFIYAIVPFIIKAILDLFNLFSNFDDMLYLKFYLPVMFVLLLIVAWRWNRAYLTSLLKDMRPFRQGHALLMFAFGAVLGPSLAWSQYTLFDLLLVAIATFWGCLFVIMTNNLEDQEIDRLVNHTRPLVSGIIPRDDYRKLAWAVGLLALIYALPVSYYTFFTILLAMGLYSIYSMPPLKLKRVPFFSKIIIAINSLAYAIMGYVFVGGEVFEFPPLVILWFLLFLTAAMNFIDIKDYEGDKKAGIRTLPVLLGLKNSQRLIGLFFLLAYVAAPFAVGQMILLIPAIAGGAIQYWLVNKNRYEEKWVFALYLVSVAVLLGTLVVARQAAIPT